MVVVIIIVVVAVEVVVIVVITVRVVVVVVVVVAVVVVVVVVVAGMVEEAVEVYATVIIRATPRKDRGGRSSSCSLESSKKWQHIVRNRKRVVTKCCCHFND